LPVVFKFKSYILNPLFHKSHGSQKKILKIKRVFFAYQTG
jgi:hypothetical protein